MIICEIGLNHLGDENYAKQYINAILATKANAITFQVIKDSFYNDERFKKFKLKKIFFQIISKIIKDGNKKFGIALDDEESIDFLEKLDVSFYKILSKDIINFKLIDALIKNTNKKIFVSTGMSDLKTIELFFQHIKSVKERFVLVHTQLSHNIEDVNLKAIDVIKDKFNLPVAFGCHCSNHNVLYLSLSFQPSDIFIYIKGDKATVHPDEDHAVLLGEIKTVINNLLELPNALGSGMKLKMKNWTER